MSILAQRDCAVAWMSVGGEILWWPCLLRVLLYITPACPHDLDPKVLVLISSE